MTSLPRVVVFIVSTLAATLHAAPPTVHVGQDNVKVSESCTLTFSTGSIADTDGNGVVQIVGHADGSPIVIDLGGAALSGGAGAAESFKGRGISIVGKGVTLRNGSIRGFKVGIVAESCDGLVLEDLITSDNYAQTLASKQSAEDASDWLFPHSNDGGEWITAHGAGLAVRDASGVTIRRVKCHRTQNGIVLDRVTNSLVYDNDCSFLSGWGIAMWRSSSNTICRNSLDFCVRGYSHGVYNRGQDSAGLLMFEQCCKNIIALNSATHGGDGIFGFAGREALGETPRANAPAAADDPAGWHRGRGCNENIFVGNDLSYAAAHGLEMTFSFDNIIARNRFEANAICGIWGGYARDTVVVGNSFLGNGVPGNGGERGGVNMEHAQRCVIEGNTFEGEPVGVRLWTDADEGLAKTPWAQANGVGAADNRIVANRFTTMEMAAQLLATKNTLFVNNTLEKCSAGLVQDGAMGTVEVGGVAPRAGPTDAELDAIVAALPGTRKAVDGRSSLRGREKIIMLQRGPYAWDAPIVTQVSGGQVRVKYKALGFMKIVGTDMLGSGPLLSGLDGDGVTIEIASNENNFAAPYILQVRDQLKKKVRVPGMIAKADWTTKFFALDSESAKLTDVPDTTAYRALATAEPHAFVFKELDFDFRGRTLQETAGSAEVTLPDLGKSRFGITSSAAMRFPVGKFRVHILSDDGIRFLIDGKPVIERWDIHAQTLDTYEFDITPARTLHFDLEYFQSSGASRLKVWFEAINPKIIG